MADLTVTAANVRALREHGAIVIPLTAGEALTVGDSFYLDTDGDALKADGNVSAAAARGRGVIVESYDGETSIASGAACSGCFFGPVAGYATVTPGANYYVSNTAGKVGDAAGTFSRILAFGTEIAGQNVLWIDPEQNDPSSA